MADLVTRIIADDKQFNDKIERSKKTVKGWGQEAGRAGQASSGFSRQLNALAGGGIAKFTGALGVATMAGAAFMKTIKSSQTTSDQFTYTLEGAKTTVDQFFKALSMGDFSNFVNGLGDVYKRARQAQIALDQLWNTQLSFNIFGSEAQFEITTARADAMDRELSPEERRKAVKDWEKSIDDMRGYAETYRKDIIETTKSIVQTYNTLASESFGIDDLFGVFKLDLIDPSQRDDVKKVISDQYKEYTAAVKKAEEEATKEYTRYTKMAHGRSAKDTYRAVDQSEFQPALRALNEQYKSAILTQSLLEAATDEQLQDIANRVQEYSNVGRQIAQLDMQINRAKPRIESQIEKDIKEEEETTVKVDIIPSGSLAELEKQISEARKSFMNATTDEARAAADSIIKHLEGQKALVEVQFKYTGLEDVGVSSDNLLRTPSTPDFSNVDMSNVIHAPDVKVFDSYTSMLHDVANENRDTIETFYGLGDAVAGLSNIVGENASKWMQWGANVLSAVGQGLPAIMAVTSAKKAEATANTASAATGAASSVAGIPVVGPVLAVAAVASILGALANLPKFAHGGIVPGNSFSGDKVLARLNSGEVVLNHAQQNRLLNIANGGGAGGGGGTIELKARGTDLYAVVERIALMKGWI